jgi:ribose transport system substrate-binding protein
MTFNTNIILGGFFMKRVLSILLCAFLFMGITAGCGQTAVSKDSGSTKKDGFVIGFSNGYIGNTWRAQLVSDFETRAKELKQSGVIKDYKIANSDNDVNQQLNQINSLISQGIDALVIVPVSPTMLGSVMPKLKAKGILGIVASDMAAYPDLINVVGNNDAFWRIEAKWLTQKLNGKGNIVEVTGLPGVATDKIRIDAAKDVLKDFPNIKVLGSAPGKWSETEAQTVMSTFLSTYSNIDGVLAEDVMADGLLRAYETVGKKLPIMTGDTTFGFIKKWSQTQGLDTIGVPYQPGLSADALNVAINLLQGKKLKDGVLQPNPLDASIKDAIIIDPPYVVTNEGDQNAPWMQGLKFTKAVSVQEALKLGEGKPDTAFLDKWLTEEQINTLFQ